MSEYIINQDGEIVLSQHTQSEQPPPRSKKLSPFDFINAITYTKQDMFPVDQYTNQRRHIGDSVYVKFLINRGISYYPDTIHYANIANTILGNVDIANHSHFDFYRLAIPKSKRFSKWGKQTVSEDVQILSQYYNVSIAKAIDIARVLNQQQIQQIKQKLDHGGIKK